MKNFKIFSLLAAILLMASCDYNEKYFEGYDDNPITDVVTYEGPYTGAYPAEGYFTDKTTLQTNVDKMLKALYLYCDAGSSAKVSVLYGDVTPGFAAADAKYTLEEADYIAMGTENGQPGKYKNFDNKMDIDSYLSTFCATKYAAMAAGKIVSITYQYYATGAGTSAQTKSYKKTGSNWVPVELEAFTADMNYTLVTEDYDAMGTTSGTPGRYDNFDVNMDINMYLTTFLGLKYPYTASGKTCEVTYKFYNATTRVTEDQSRIYKYDGSAWNYFDPYADTVNVSMKIAEVAFDGTTWVLKRLLGGSIKYTLVNTDYQAILDWVKANKPDYVNPGAPEEFYSGAATGTYNNINNSYNTWKNYYNVNGQYTNKSNEEIQAIMDDRITETISKAVMPVFVGSKPDPGISYVITYKVYSGRGDGFYAISLMYNEEEKEYERVAGPVKQ